MLVAVTRGAGYLGSHTVLALLEAGHEVVILDNFSHAKDAVLQRLGRLAPRPFLTEAVDATDAAALSLSFEEHSPDAVIHFAALKSVAESTRIPTEYYRNNVGSTIAVLQAMAAQGVDRLIFSSSATVYGGGQSPPYAEDAATDPVNPYGRTKLMSEQIIGDAAAASTTLRVAVLRYFNPAGAHPSGLLGEDPTGTPTNLVPILSRVASGRLPCLEVFGDDYATPDGTAVRDYVHVQDLAEAHVVTLEAMDRAERAHTIWNVGTGRPTSVLELLRIFEQQSGRDIPYRIAPRRAGDLPVAYADPGRMRAAVGWQPSRSIAEVCADEWNWRCVSPDGFDVEVR